MRECIHHNADEWKVERHHPRLDLYVGVALVCVVTCHQVTDGVDGTPMDGGITVVVVVVERKEKGVRREEEHWQWTRKREIMEEGER